jgi:hypothetical protein
VLAADRLDDAPLNNALARYRANRDRDARRQELGWSVAASAAFAAGDYAAAAARGPRPAARGDQWLRWLPVGATAEQLADVNNLRRTAAALSHAPRQKLLAQRPKSVALLSG